MYTNTLKHFLTHSLEDLQDANLAYLLAQNLDGFDERFRIQDGGSVAKTPFWLIWIIEELSALGFVFKDEVVSDIYAQAVEFHPQMVAVATNFINKIIPLRVLEQEYGCYLYFMDIADDPVEEFPTEGLDYVLMPIKDGMDLYEIEVNPWMFVKGNEEEIYSYLIGIKNYLDYLAVPTR